MHARNVTLERKPNGWVVEVWSVLGDGYGESSPEIVERVHLVEIGGIEIEHLDLNDVPHGGTRLKMGRVDVNFRQADLVETTESKSVVEITSRENVGPDATIGIERI